MQAACHTHPSPFREYNGKRWKEKRWVEKGEGAERQVKEMGGDGME